MLQGDDLISHRLSIFFREDETPAWYDGCVAAHESGKGLHRVKFDDGTSEWYDLSQEEQDGNLRWPQKAWPCGEPVPLGRSARRRCRDSVSPDSVAPEPGKRLLMTVWFMS